jgi:hypothetical protein
MDVAVAPDYQAPEAPFDAVGQPHHHSAVADPSVFVQICRDSGRPTIEFAPHHRFANILQGNRIGPLGRMTGERTAEVAFRPHPFAVVALRAGRAMESQLRLHPILAVQHSMIASGVLLYPKHEQYPCHPEVVDFISPDSLFSPDPFELVSLKMAQFLESASSENSRVLKKDTAKRPHKFV